MALTEMEVRKAKPTEKPYKLTDGGGLFLLVQVNGGKYWRLAYRFDSKQKTLSLGVYPDVGLSDARERREQTRKLLANGADPGAVKQAAKLENRKASQIAENSFAVLAVEFHTLKAPMWTAQHAKQWMGNMEKYAHSNNFSPAFRLMDLGVEGCISFISQSQTSRSRAVHGLKAGF